MRRAHIFLWICFASSQIGAFIIPFPEPMINSCLKTSFGTTTSTVSTISCCANLKRPTVCDASDEWPPDLPSWAHREWMTPTVLDRNNDDDEHGKAMIVFNDSHTWELVLTRAWPEGATVVPASAFLAPKGGCDNLCNEGERYTDYCEFTASDDAAWVLVRSEEKEWTFKIGSTKEVYR